jgi:hypothetical protein
MSATPLRDTDPEATASISSNGSGVSSSGAASGWGASVVTGVQNTFWVGNVPP